MHGDARLYTISQQEDKGDTKERPTPASKAEEIMLDEDRSERKVKIGTTLELELWERIITVLVKFKVIFTWGPEEMLGVDRSVVYHHLSVIPSSKPIKQKKRHLTHERREFVTKETTTLLAVGHI